MPDERPQLYTTLLSANGRKPLLVGHHLGLDLGIVEVNVYEGEGQQPEYLALNPLGKIPTLVDGDLTLWESNAIAVYLCEAYGDCRLWGREPRLRADIARWLFWEASLWQPSFVPILTEKAAHLLFGRTEEAEAVEVRWDDPAFARLATVLERHLGERSFLTGDELTLADFVVAAMLTYARRTGFPFGEYPVLASWFGRIEETAAWKATAVEPWSG